MVLSRIASFSLPQDITYPHGAALTDINKNGFPEIIVIRFQFPGGEPLPIPFYEIRPDGSFADISTMIFADGFIPFTDFGRGIVVGDITRNGFDDIIIADHGFDQMPFPGAINPVYINNGAGQLVDRSAEFSKGADFTHSVAWGDLTGNGRSDIFFNNLGVNNSYIVSIDENQEPVIGKIELPFSVNSFASILIKDLNKSGIDQVVLGVDRNVGASNSLILSWNGDEFDVLNLPPSNFFEREIVLDIESVDLNGNGLEDLILLKTSADPFYTGFALQFLVQQENGTFLDETDKFINRDNFASSESGSSWGRYILMDDLNGNGLQDLIIEMDFPENHKLFMQTSPGKFEKINVEFGNMNETLILADVTFNGRNELVVIGSKSVNVYEFSIADQKFIRLPDAVEGGVYRFYNDATGVHFFTISSEERDMIINSMPTFRYEGVAFTTSAQPEDGIPIFRFFNEETGAHFYTASEEERDRILIDLPSFSFEGSAFFAFEEERSDRQAVYRFYNNETSTHFYTASDVERDNIILMLPSFDFEGIAYFVDIA